MEVIKEASRKRWEERKGTGKDGGCGWSCSSTRDRQYGGGGQLQRSFFKREGR